MVPSGSSWYEVNNSVPGASFCRVYEHPQVIYTCEWTRGPKAPIFSALAKEIEEALETRWKRADQSGRRKIARFAPINADSRDGIIQLEETNTGLKLVVHASSQER